MFTRTMILLAALIAVPAFAQIEPTAEEVAGPWSGKVSFGFLATSGNTDNSNLNGNFEIGYAKGKWSHLFDAYAINASENNATTAEALRVFELLVFIAADTVEFEQPVLESFARRYLSGADFVGRGIPTNHCLGSSAACRCAHAKKVGHGPSLFGVSERNAERVSMREHLGCKFNELADLYAVGLARSRPERRSKFQGTHAAGAGVTEPLNGIERFRWATLRGQPGIDQCVAEAVGQ